MMLKSGVVIDGKKTSKAKVKTKKINKQDDTSNTSSEDKSQSNNLQKNKPGIPNQALHNGKQKKYYRNGVLKLEGNFVKRMLKGYEYDNNTFCRRLNR